MPLHAVQQWEVVEETAPLVVGLATESDGPAWDRFVAGHPHATGYHLWGWRQVVTNAFGHELVYLVARQDSRIVGVLPIVHINSRLFGQSMTSMPFLNYGGVVADSDAVAAALLDGAADEASRRRCRTVELRHVARRFPHLSCKQHKVTMLLTLKDGMWDRLDRKVRNQIRKAQKSGLTVEQGGAELLRDFYAVFARNMRDLGTPVYSPRLFDEVLGAFPDRASLHVVRLNGAPVAAGLVFGTHTVEVPWASSIREHNNLCPNHLLYWHVIAQAVERGARVVDFGRSTPDEGTYKFKEQWGAQPVPLHWEYWLAPGVAVPNASPTNPKYRVAIDLWKKLPLAIANRLGPAIVQAIP